VSLGTWRNKRPLGIPDDASAVCKDSGEHAHELCSSLDVAGWKVQCTCSIVGRQDCRVLGAYHELCKTAPWEK